MISLFSALAMILLLLNLSGCGQPNYQYSQKKNGILVEIAISPYPQESLAPTTYTLHVTRNGQPVEGKVAVGFHMQEMAMSDNLTPALAKGNGIYEIKENLSMAGKWQIIVSVNSEKFVFNTTAQ